MANISCKNCGTKYPTDVSKCPVCGASNAPSIGDEFDFLDDDFEAAPVAPPVIREEPAPVAEEPAAEAPEAAPAADPTFTTGAPSSGNTGRYNWEDILAEINGTKKPESAAEEPEAAEEPQPAFEEPVVVPVPAEEEAAPVEEKPRTAPVRQKEEPQKKNGAMKAIAIFLVIVIIVAAAAIVLKKTGTLDKLFAKEEQVEEIPELPVEEDPDVACSGISLSVSELAVTGIGNTAALQATVSPSDCTDKINWFSGDPAIATVDANGNVTAVAEGRVNIQATCGDYAATCMVIVSAQAAEATEESSEEAAETEETQEPTGEPELSATDVTMTYPGEMARLYVNNVADDAEITWSTDNETILSVDETGLITALGTGTTNVYAEVNGTTLECIVRLRLGGTEGVAITVSLNATDISMFYVGETFKIEVEYAQGEPEGVVHEWTSSDESVCTVDADGIVTAVANGVSYISTTADGVNLKCIIRVSIQ
ncbi:MAG: Ig-like domain-containing protein [Oscillospiraceae bacterium]|nr:Ig-like domain-containing protein [Oscillospiraceae bacterium]